MNTKIIQFLINLVQKYIFYIFVVLLVTVPWLSQSGYLFFVDFSWGQHVPLVWFDGLFFFYLAIHVLSFILPLWWLQKLFICLIIVFLLWGGKNIAEQFVSSKLQVYLVSLFALFNPFVYDRFVYGQFGILAGLGLLAMSVGYGIGYIKKRSLIDICKAAISFGFASQFSSFVLVFALPVGLLFFLLALQGRAVDIKRILIHILSACFIVLILNGHWILGALSQESPLYDAIANQIGYEDLYIFQPAGETAINVIVNQFRLSGFWASEINRYQGLHTLDRWGRSFFVTLPVIFFGIITGLRSKRDKRLSLGFFVLTFCSFVLALGIRVAGVRELTFWLFDHSSIYRGFRETHKWMMLVYIGYLIFFSIGLRQLFSFSFIRARQRVISVFFAFIIIMQAPLMLLGLSGQVRAAEYPPDWYEVDKYIIDGGCGDGILFLPWHQYMSFEFIGRIVYNPADAFFTCPTLQSHNPELSETHQFQEDQQPKNVYEWLEGSSNDSLLTSLPFTYIILAKEVDWQKYLWLDEHCQFEQVWDSENFRIYKRRYEE